MSGIIGGAGSRSGIIGQTEIDYEEGTWTPAFLGTTSQSGQGYDSQHGTYVKIGKWVHCHFFIDMNTEGTFNGMLALGTFPFATATTAIGGSALGTGGPLYFQVSGDSQIYFNLQLGASSTTAYLWTKSSSTGSREYPGNSSLNPATIMSGTFGYQTA